MLWSHAGIVNSPRIKAPVFLSDLGGIPALGRTSLPHARARAPEPGRESPDRVLEQRFTVR